MSMELDMYTTIVTNILLVKHLKVEAKPYYIYIVTHECNYLCNLCIYIVVDIVYLKITVIVSR